MASVADETLSGCDTAEMTRSCLRKFQKCVSTVEGDEKIHLQTRLADFRLWADSVGATAKAQASLDRRLQHRSSDIQFIRDFLHMLEGLIDDYYLSSSSSSDLQDMIANIDSVVDSLAFIGVQIRRSGRKSRLRKADNSYDRYQYRYKKFRAHLACVMVSKPTEAGRPVGEDERFQSVDYFTNLRFSPIQERLIEANLRRRYRFIEVQRHSEGLKDQSVVVMRKEAQQKTSKAGVNREYKIESYKEDEKDNLAPKATQTSTGPMISASTMGSGWEGLQSQSRRGSANTGITAITASARYPKIRGPPHKTQSLVRYPCCCQAVAAVKLEDNQRRLVAS